MTAEKLSFFSPWFPPGHFLIFQEGTPSPPTAQLLCFLVKLCNSQWSRSAQLEIFGPFSYPPESASYLYWQSLIPPSPVESTFPQTATRRFFPYAFPSLSPSQRPGGCFFPLHRLRLPQVRALFLRPTCARPFKLAAPGVGLSFFLLTSPSFFS